MKTFMLRKEDVVTKWYLIDAEGKTLGSVATKAAHILRGKHKVTFTPKFDSYTFLKILFCLDKT